MNLSGEKDRQAISRQLQQIDEPVPKQRRSRKPLIILTAIVVLGILLSAGWLLFSRRRVAAPPPEQPISQQEADKPVEVAKETEPEFDADKLQKVLDDWDKSVGGTASVVITDKDGQRLASINPDKQYFAASIYKLYVAYEGYRAVDNGTYKLSESYLNSWTRGKCLDEMIRSSHSPCAEKMWVELGKENLNSKMRAYGLKNTSMTGIMTSAADAAIILSRIERAQALKKASRDAFLDSMHKQIYQQTLQTGFKKAEVFSKIGFRENDEYHDTAIVHLSDGRSLIVSVLTSGVGTRNIARLGTLIEAAL